MRSGYHFSNNIVPVLQYASGLDVVYFCQRLADIKSPESIWWTGVSITVVCIQLMGTFEKELLAYGAARADFQHVPGVAEFSRVEASGDFFSIV